MSEQPTVTVSANVAREVLPDSFVLSAGVRGLGNDAASARAALVARYTELETAAGRLPDSVQLRHGRVTIWPAGPKQRRWEAGRTLSATGTDLESVGAVADALGQFDDVTLSGPEWQVDRDNPAYEELQTEVVREARARAGRYATAVGATLGRLVEIQDPGVGGGMRIHAAARFGDAGGSPGQLSELDLTPQTLTITATVNARWYLVLPD